MKSLSLNPNDSFSPLSLTFALLLCPCINILSLFADCQAAFVAFRLSGCRSAYLRFVAPTLSGLFLTQTATTDFLRSAFAAYHAASEAFLHTRQRRPIKSDPHLTHVFLRCCSVNASRHGSSMLTPSPPTKPQTPYSAAHPARPDSVAANPCKGCGSPLSDSARVRTA